MHTDRTIRRHRDFCDLGARRRLPFGDGDAASTTGWKGGAPSCLRCGQLECAQVPRFRLQELAAEVVWISPRRGRKLIHETLDDKRVLRRAHGTPEPERD